MNRKYRFFKKAISVLLCLLLALGTAVPAFAMEDYDDLEEIRDALNAAAEITNPLKVDYVMANISKVLTIMLTNYNTDKAGKIADEAQRLAAIKAAQELAIKEANSWTSLAKSYFGMAMDVVGYIGTALTAINGTITMLKTEGKIAFRTRSSKGGLGEGYDLLIIDEAQDLITSKYLDVFEKCLSGGLARGRWTFLGDFSQQAIYSNSVTGSKMKDMIEDRTSFIRFKLTVNCRNTRTICDEISLVTDFQAPSDVWSKVDGMPVQYITYASREEEKTKLTETIRTLMDAHISPKKISILSPVKKDKSIVSEITDYDIRDYKTYSNNNRVSVLPSLSGCPPLRLPLYHRLK